MTIEHCCDGIYCGLDHSPECPTLKDANMTHPADALPLPEPEWPACIKALDEICLEAIHNELSIRVTAAHREGYELAMSKKVADIDECKRLANVYANAWALVHNTPHDSSLLEGRQERFTNACKDLHAAIDALASQPAQEHQISTPEIPDSSLDGQQQAGAAEVSDEQIYALCLEHLDKGGLTWDRVFRCTEGEIRSLVRAVLALKAGGVA